MPYQARFSIGVFQDRLRQTRSQQGLSQDRLAAILETSQSWISELETDEEPHPELKTLFRLARALDVSGDYLLGLTDDPTPSPRLSQHRTVGHDHA
jgi:transcriptional regulator with XRE-family HTH domain